MVALASDWRLAEERAQRFLSPARIVERYRQIADLLDVCQNAPLTYRQMLEAVIAHDGLEEHSQSNHRFAAD
jgi:hypothetical protein